jgi:MFS family permease
VRDNDNRGTGTHSRLPGLLYAFRFRNYRLFFGGQLISLTGTWMQMVAQSWLVYRLTGSAVLLGVVGFSTQIPVFLLSPIGGAVADRVSRRRILVATQTTAMLLAFILAFLTLTNRIHVWHIVCLASLLGITNAFDIPARQAFVADLVGRDNLLNAIALNSSMFNGARIIGPAVAGVLVAAVGEGWCFFMNAVSYIAVIAGLLWMRMIAAPRPLSRETTFARIAEGFRFAWRARPVRALLLLLGLVSITGMPYAVLMPIFADKILHGGPRGLGLLMGASGIGALVASLTLAAQRSIRRLPHFVAVSAGSFGTCLILFSWSRSFWLSAALLVPVGFSMMVEMASSNTLIQSMVPDALRGRVMAVYSMMFLGMAPFGALLAGTLAHHIGAPGTLTIGGLVCIAGAAVFAVRMPDLGGEASRMITALQVAGGGPGDEMTGPGTAVAAPRDNSSSS